MTNGNVWVPRLKRAALMGVLIITTAFPLVFVLAVTPLVGPAPYVSFFLIFCLVSLLFSYVHAGVTGRTKAFAGALLSIAAGLSFGGLEHNSRRLKERGFEVMQQHRGVALVTGSTRGIGFEVARLMLEQGWTIFLHGRSVTSMQEAKRKLSVVPGGGTVIVLPVGCDMTSFADVKAFALALLARLSKDKLRLSHVIMNAGMTAPCFMTEAGFESIVQANYLSPELMQHLLLPHLEENRGTIVHVASAAHYQAPWMISKNLRWNESSGMDLYGRSKLLQIASSYALGTDPNVKLGRIVSVHPGACYTDMSEEGPRKIFEGSVIHPFGEWLGPMIPALLRRTWFPVSYCAENVLFGAFAPGIPSGSYIQHFRVADAFLEFPIQLSAEFAHRVREQTQSVVQQALGT